MTEFQEVLVHTGQHFEDDMSDVFFRELNLPTPVINLGIHGGSHGEMTARMLIGLEAVLMQERPNAVLVYGDTNSTLAAALAAAKLNVPVAHVEAGLRSFNRTMPEEVNRAVTDHVSEWLFAPSALAKENLRREGCAEGRIHVVGDVMYDLALAHGDAARERSARILERVGVTPGGYVLATIHRAENTNRTDRLETLTAALRTVARRLPVVWPIHPRTEAALDALGLLDDLRGRLAIIEPVGYLAMLGLEASAAVIATDSGGVQKEAFFHRVPCVTMREETEWGELLELGWNQLVPPVSHELVSRAILEAVGRTGREATPYGRGDAATQIVDVLHASLAHD
jgi:UDP-GlcNAc3NAcA epimerase